MGKGINTKRLAKGMVRPTRNGVELNWPETVFLCYSVDLRCHVDVVGPELSALCVEGTCVSVDDKNKISNLERSSRHSHGGRLESRIPPLSVYYCSKKERLDGLDSCHCWV